MAHVESEIDGSTVYFLDDYTEAKSYLNEIRSRDPEFSFRYCEKLCRDVFGEEVID